MNDMSQTIIAKSDQINAGDLKGISRTVTIKEVRIKAGEDQPVSILIEGDNKAFRPCKGVRRLLVRVWGADAAKYIGQSLTLFCDASVTWAGKEEGGIRVSHMTGINEQIIEYMRISKAATKPYKILPLAMERAEPDRATLAEKLTVQTLTGIATQPDIESLTAFINARMAKLNKLNPDFADKFQRIDDALRLRREELSSEQRRADEQHGDQFADDVF